MGSFPAQWPGGTPAGEAGNDAQLIRTNFSQPDTDYVLAQHEEVVRVFERIHPNQLCCSPMRKKTSLRSQVSREPTGGKSGTPTH